MSAKVISVSLMVLGIVFWLSSFWFGYWLVHFSGGASVWQYVPILVTGWTFAILGLVAFIAGAVVGVEVIEKGRKHD
jgi:hypothetical protein